VLLLNLSAEEPEELVSVCVIKEDALLCVAAGGEVIEGAGEF
jgi:hypothetical protein